MENLKRILEQELENLQNKMQQNRHLLKPFTGGKKEDNFFQLLDDKAASLLKKDNQNTYIKYFIFRLSLVKSFLKLVENPQLYLFQNLKGMCNYLEILSIPTTDCIEILLSCIENNIKLGLLEEHSDITSSSIFQFTIVSTSEFLSFFKLEKTILSHLEEKKYFGTIVDTVEIPMSLLQSTHRVIKESYFQKKNTYTSADIKKIITAFHQLQIPGYFCGSFEKQLKSNLEKRKKQTVVSTQTKEKISDRLDIKQHLKIQKIIQIYWNDYTGKVRKAMTEEEIQYVASLMIQLKYDREEINCFFRSAKQLLKKDIKNSIEEFISLYDRLDFYSRDDINLKQLQEEAVAYLLELYGCYSKDYDFWYQEFQSVVFKIRMQIDRKSVV